MPSSRVRLAALLVALGVSACGGGGDDPTGPGGNNNGNGNPGRVIKVSPSFASDIQEILNRRGCTGSSCHGSAASGGLQLETGVAYANLVNRPSGCNSIRVVPGDAQNSYLVIKLEGRQSCGARMPLGLTPLDSIDMGNIRNWINQGANQN